MSGGKRMVFSREEKYTDILLKLTGGDLLIEERKKIIKEVADAYYEETGNILPSYLADMFANWLLKEVYADKRVNKVLLEEYPILSENQLLRRNRKTVLIPEENTLDTLNFHLRNNSSTSKHVVSTMKNKKGDNGEESY